MVVTWVTFWPTNSSMVEYGTQKLDTVANGTETHYIDPGSQRNYYMHQVTLSSLIPGQKYYYHCGSDVCGWSSLFFFTSMQSGQKWSPRLCLYGDLGNIKATTVPRLQTWAVSDKFDVILHVGDIAYNLDADRGLIGDEFMRELEPIAAFIPYMVTPGNHEEAYNFTHFKNRFHMPRNGDGENIYYSYNMGPMHIISFSSEVYAHKDKNGGDSHAHNMYAWMERDLEIANRPENRAIRPWIITLAHRPMYCSNSDDPTICFNKTNPVRVGLPGKSIEDLLCKYGVDIHFAGHEHSYERILPIYNYEIRNGSFSHPYTNPKATIHIVTGSAGNQEPQDPFFDLKHPFSVFHSDDYGFTIMYVKNGTHINIQQISDDKGGEVIDDFWIIKETIGAPKFDCTK